MKRVQPHAVAISYPPRRVRNRVRKRVRIHSARLLHAAVDANAFAVPDAMPIVVCYASAHLSLDFSAALKNCSQRGSHLESNEKTTKHIVCSRAFCILRSCMLMGLTRSGYHLEGVKSPSSKGNSPGNLTRRILA